MDDYRCPMLYAEDLYHHLPTPEKYFVTRFFAHYELARIESTVFADEMEWIIMTGRTPDMLLSQA